MIFKVVPWRTPIATRSEEPVVFLTRDSWNDYGFNTTFHAKLVTKSDLVDLGTVKILHVDQESGPTPIYPTFMELPNTYCSLGQTMSYYESLKSLNDPIGIDILRALRDVVFDIKILMQFEHTPGFKNSLIRGSAAERILIDAPILFHPTAESQIDESQSDVVLEFLTNVGGNRFEFKLKFARGGELPGRLNALIGYNGSGKTRLLANIAMLTATPQADSGSDDFVRKYGQILKKYPFGGTFAVSYSAFDDFELPGLNPEEKRMVSEREEEYIYCGLRRLASDEVSDEIEDSILSESDKQVKLKSSREIRDTFEQALRKIQRSDDRRKTFVEALMPISIEPSFSRFGLVSTLTDFDDSPLQFFKHLSSGHKLVLNVVTQMAANLQRKSLVLFDEPEAHLHPPLLAALLKSLRIILEKTDSFCLMATHSPVVLQETPKRFVQIVRRNGQKTHILEPQIETFGENVGALTHEVFSLDGSKTDFHDTLATLAMDRSLLEIEEIFGSPLGFQARSYLFSMGVKES
jgi:predicted ATPase